jgi:hypothetical protein
MAHLMNERPLRESDGSHAVQDTTRVVPLRVLADELFYFRMEGWELVAALPVKGHKKRVRLILRRIMPSAFAPILPVPREGAFDHSPMFSGPCQPSREGGMCGCGEPDDGKTLFVPARDGLTPNEVRRTQDRLNEFISLLGIDKFVVLPPGAKVLGKRDGDADA